MALHPHLKAIIEAAAALPATHTLSVAAARDAAAARYAALPRREVAAVDDWKIDGPGGRLRLRIYRPYMAPNLPVTMYFHGGGFVVGSVDTHDALARELCLRSGTVVVSVDYRLAPEHPFPAALDDCEAATLWARSSIGAHGGDANKTALAGDSAGGALAIATAMRLRDQAKLRAMLLFYPMTDHPSAQLPSYTERAIGFGLSRDTMNWFWGHYLSDAAQAAHPHVSPNRAADLAGLPPAYVVTAEYDPLRDDGLLFARRLAAAGVEVVQSHYDDMNHGFALMAGSMERPAQALQAAGEWLARKM